MRQVRSGRRRAESERQTKSQAGDDDQETDERTPPSHPVLRLGDERREPVRQPRRMRGHKASIASTSEGVKAFCESTAR